MADKKILEHCVRRIEEQFILQDREYWAEKLVEADIPFERTLQWKDIPTDQQAIDNNYVKEFKMKSGNWIPNQLRFWENILRKSFPN